jgi:hypothetical protein
LGLSNSNSTLPVIRHTDISDERGYRFTFTCDICGDEYLTDYNEADSNRKGEFIKITSRAISLGTSIVDLIPATRGTDLERVDSRQSEFSEILSSRYEGMSPEWQRGRDLAFSHSLKEAEKYFHNCSVCKRWACPRDWHAESALCTEHSTQKMCPTCRYPTGSSKFCTNCGTQMENECPSCGARFMTGIKFCGECGEDLAARMEGN